MTHTGVYGWTIFRGKERAKLAKANNWRKVEFFRNAECDDQVKKKWWALGDKARKEFSNLAKKLNSANRDPAQKKQRRQELRLQRESLTRKRKAPDDSAQRHQESRSFHTPLGIGDDSNPVSVSVVCEAKKAGLIKAVAAADCKAMTNQAPEKCIKTKFRYLIVALSALFILILES